MKHQTPYAKELRLRWYRQVDAEKRSVKEVCKLFGIPRKTYYKWRNHDLGRNPHDYQNHQQQPRLKLTSEVRKWIEDEKRRSNYGPLKMSLWMKDIHNIAVSPTIIYRYYRKRGSFEDHKESFLGINH